MLRFRFSFAISAWGPLGHIRQASEAKRKRITERKNPSKLPGCIPCSIGKAQEPRTTPLNTHVADIARAFGASAKVMEVRLGCKEVGR